ncbi:MAG: hypothetical protein P1P77_11305, partial [Spirochaetaceae bacterium]|nr:hypothetical protein [Spirochaetaceae bacterium]
MESFRWQKTDEAAVYFLKASELNPGRDDYFLYLGLCYHENGSFQSAEEVYGKGISLDGGMRDRLLLNRGNLRMTRSDFEGASDDFSRIINSGGSLAASAM